jgi:hypothetical protein
MVAMRMMQVAGDQVIHVIAMRNRGVAAVGAMDMCGIMAGASVVGGALIGVGGGHGDDVFVHVPGVGVMQMAVVQVIHMVVVADGEVAAIGAMLMRMVSVDVAVAHKRCG